MNDSEEKDTVWFLLDISHNQLNEKLEHEYASKKELMSDERFITFCYNLEAEERKRHFDETPAIPQNIILEKVNTCHEVESLKKKPIFL